MSESDGMYDAKPIRGDFFVDRLVGYTTLALSLVVLGAAVYRLATTGHAATEGVRVALILAAMAGALAIVRSSREAFAVATCLFALRLAAGLAYLPQLATDRYLSMQLFFDLAMIAYCVLRGKALGR